MGLAANTWVPMGAQVSVLSPNDHPNPSQGQHKGFGKNPIFENFEAAHASLKIVKSSPAKAHRGDGGGDPQFGPKTPAIGEGSMYKEKDVEVQIDAQRPQYAKSV